MDLLPLRPPHSVRTYVTWHYTSKEEILCYLHNHFMEDCEFWNSNKLSAVDSHGYWRWRVALRENDHRVLLERSDDLTQFVLSWHCDFKTDV